MPYCPNCGTKVEDTAKFCSECGKPLAKQNTVPPSPVQPQQPQTPVAQNPVQPQPPQTPMQPQQRSTYTLTVIREHQTFAVQPTLEVYVDGNQVATISDKDATASMSITPGAHEILFKSSFRKRKNQVFVNSDMTMVVRFDRITGGLVVR